MSGYSAIVLGVCFPAVVEDGPLHLPSCRCFFLLSYAVAKFQVVALLDNGCCWLLTSAAIGLVCKLVDGFYENDKASPIAPHRPCQWIVGAFSSQDSGSMDIELGYWVMVTVGKHDSDEIYVF